MSRNSVILMWASGKSLPIILDLINSWGYRFINFLLVWVKLTKDGLLRMGLGFWTRNNSEFLILAIKG